MKKRLTILIAVLLVGLQASAYDFEIDGIYYNVIDATSKNVEVTSGGKAYSGDVVIPSHVTYEGTEYTVTQIDDKAFAVSSWKTLGKCKYTEHMVLELFGNPEITYEVEIQESTEKSGYFRLINPYKSLFSNGYYDDTTNHYMYIDATNPEQVYIPEFQTGLNLGYGNISLISTAGYYLEKGYEEEASMYYGKLNDGVISFPANGMVISMSEYQEGAWFIINTSGLFQIVLPESAAKSKALKTPNNIKNANITKQLRDDVLMLPTLNNDSQKGTPLQCKSFRSASANNTRLTSISLPNTLLKIGEEAFYGCAGLTEITIPSSVVHLGNFAFRNCTGLSVVNFNAENCQQMGYNSWQNSIAPIFYGCSNLNTLNIGENVERIPHAAFSYCTNIKEVTIPESVIQIDKYAFAFCDNLSVVNYNSNLQYGSGGIVFYQCNALKTVNIGNNVKYIWEIFRNCSSLTTVNFPSSLESIAGGAFSDCTSLTSLNIPESVTEIYGDAFAGCTGLTSFSISANLIRFSTSALDRCTSLKEINVASENPEFLSEDGVLYSKNKTYILKYPIAKPQTNYVIDANVETIGSCAFEGCKNLTNIEIPEGVKVLGYRAFYDCENISHFSIPKSVTNIYDEVFLNTAWYNNQAEGLVYLDDCCLGYLGLHQGALSLNENTRVIASAAFSNQSAITEVKLPNSLITIGSYAFNGCSNLTEIIIPNSVTEIGYGAFSDCSNMTKVNLPTGLTEIKSDLFIRSGIKEIHIPSSVTKIGEWAFQSCDNLTSLEIPNSVTEIGQYAFSLCRNLTSVVLPNTITKINFATFWECMQLTSITIPSSIEEIASSAFNGCKDLNKIRVLNPVPPLCQEGAFEQCYNAILQVPANSKEAYSVATEWEKFSNIIEVATADVTTNEDYATFEIPTVDGAAAYTINIYSDETMTQLVATINYDANGQVITRAAKVELSVDGLESGTYYYDIIVKSETGETLATYAGEFVISIETSIVDILPVNTYEVERYDANGRLITTPVKGINILRYSNGAVKKIIVR